MQPMAFKPKIKTNKQQLYYTELKYQADDNGTDPQVATAIQGRSVQIYVNENK